jgi:hypothetical protein
MDHKEFVINDNVDNLNLKMMEMLEAEIELIYQYYFLEQIKLTTDFALDR